MDSISAASLAARGVAYAPEILHAATNHGLDPALLAAVAAQETGGPGANAGRNVVGDGGHGHGLFQIDDRFHAFARTAAAMNPAANAEYAAAMLARLIGRYGSVRQALSAYNAGDPDGVGTVTQWRDGARLGYADSVLRHEGLITGSAPSDSVPSMPTDSAGGALVAWALSQPLTLPPPAQIRTFREIAGLDDLGDLRDGSQDEPDDT